MRNKPRAHRRDNDWVTTGMRGGGSESKKQLGKILLQQKLVTPDELQEMLDEQKREPHSRLASSATRSGRLRMADALGALSEQHGVPSIDLTEQVVQLALLRLVPIELAREHAVFPVQLDGDHLVLAMSSPDVVDVLQELEFVTAKPITPWVALDQVIREVIEHAYAALAGGEDYYVGARVTSEQLAQLGLPELPRAPVPLGFNTTPPPEPSLPLPAAPVPGLSQSVAPALEGAIDEAFGARTMPSMPPQMRAPDTGARVLVAISDRDLRAAVQRSLQAVGLSLLEASDSTQVLELLRSMPRVLVLESALSSEHGFDLCRKLRADPRYAQLPVIVISSVAGGWRLARDLQDTLSVQHCFERPLDLARFTRTLRLVIEDQPVLDEVPPLSPEVEPHFGRGMAAFERGDLDAAIIQLTAGAALDPEAFELHYHLALLHGQRGELFAAIQALEAALRLQPRNFLAMKNLAVIYQRAGFRYAAIDAWQRAMVHAPDAETRTNIKQHMVSLL